jgi:hypothetical protein
MLVGAYPTASGASVGVSVCAAAIAGKAMPHAKTNRKTIMRYFPLDSPKPGPGVKGPAARVKRRPASYRLDLLLFLIRSI